MAKATPEMTVAKATTDAYFMARLLSLFTPDAERRLSLTDDGMAKLYAVVDAAGALHESIEPLLTIVRMMMALEQRGHPEAASQVASAIRSSKAALERLQKIRSPGAWSSAAFDRFADRRAIKQAPKQDSAPPPQAVTLKDLLPPGAGRRPTVRQQSTPQTQSHRNKPARRRPGHLDSPD